MRTPLPYSYRIDRIFSGSRRGSALIIVLGCLVFITILILAFFTSITTERKSAQSYANNSSVKLLADSTVDIVIGQIKDATKGETTGGATLAWASQPGMIRTYNEQGQAESYFKLYSWSDMVGTGAFNPSAATEVPPSTWMNNPALYTDLNDPVSGVYPVVDPSAAGVVQGFKITAAPVSGTNTAPMPVQWLYLLQDGKLAPASATATGTTANVPLATSANPIVGRIAFWTDDDTSKVNINTAAGDVWASPSPGIAGNPGAFWDTPRTNSSFERTYLAKYQPGKDEYQRFPGHPATTYLSAVFPTLTTTNIFNIAPKVSSGGSISGSAVASVSPVAVDSARLYASVDELLFSAGTPQATPPDPRPSTSGLTRDSINQSRFFLTAHSRAPEINLYNKPRITIWPVSSSIGASARTAYDSLIAACGTLNQKAFYFQRSSSTSQTADLPKPADAALSPDGLGRNRYLISYLRDLTSKPIPGFSTVPLDTFLTKYPKDRDQILTEIFDYIRSLNTQDTTVAGLTPFTVLGASTLGTTGQGQVLPIIDDTHSDSNTTETLRGFGRFPTIREATLLFAGVGQTKGVTSAMPSNTQNYNSAAIADGYTRVQAAFILNFFDPSQGYAAGVPDFKVRVKNLENFKWEGVAMGFGANATVTVTKNWNTGLFGGYKGASSFIQGRVASPGSEFNSAFISLTKDFPSTSSASPTTFAFTGNDITVEILNSAGTIVLQTLTLNFPSKSFPVPELAPMFRDAGSVPLPSPPNTYVFDYRILKVSALTSASNNGRFSGSGVNTGATTSGKMWICGKDVVRSVVANTDQRIIAAKAVVPSSFFSAVEGYDDSSVKQAHGIAETLNGGGSYAFIGSRLGKFVQNADYGSPGGAGSPAPVTAANSDFTYTGVESDTLQPTAGQVAGNFQGLKGYAMPVAFGMEGGTCKPVNGVAAGTNETGSGISSKPPGDWDTGMSLTGDGAFINKADEGNISNLVTGSLAYYEGLSVFTNSGGTFFSPNRQIPSAGMFGSLSTGVHANKPWQTLLFRPDPGGTPQHTGAQIPPDHLLLDLFTMPVVEPYAISDPFSTAGKINMNYQIVPFTYITRSTGLRAVLKAEQILTLKNTDASTYKANAFTNRRAYLDLDQTLAGFETRFTSGDIFRSASEICNIWLVPTGETYAGMPAFWNGYQLTGDNIRERPYANIYPRLTTKSNTYTVHYRVQTLKKVNRTAANQWVEGADSVTGEYRGSSVLERYLDTNDTTIPDYAVDVNPLPIDTFYKFRVVETKQFSP